MKNCPLPKKVHFTKKKGSVEMVSIDMMMVTKYKDNSVLTLAFNFESAKIEKTQRYSRKKK